MIKITTIVNKKTVRISLSKNDIIKLLTECNVLPKSENAEFEVYFKVPGGGDYSNCDIDIDSDNRVYVEYVTHENIDH